MNADAVANQPPVVALRFSCITQAGQPCQGSGNFTAIDKHHMQCIVRKVYINGVGVNL